MSGAARSASRGAILLAGGRASRMGGIDKPLLKVGGVSLLQHAVTAATDAGCAPIVVAGPAAAGVVGAVEWVREDPPFTGPAAALVAALTRPQAPSPAPEWTLVLACDLPRAQAAARHLLDDVALLPDDTDGACLADAAGRPQWLTGLYRTSALRQAAVSLADGGRDASVRALVADLAIAVIRAGDEVDDVDTWEDFQRITKETP